MSIKDININLDLLPSTSKNWIRSVMEGNKTLRCLREHRQTAKDKKDFDKFLQLGLALRFLSDLEIIKNNTQ